MSFLDNVFGAAGCNPDGTVGQNAFTRFVDASMDGSLVQEQAQQTEMMQEMNAIDVMQHQSMGGGSHSSVQPMPQQYGGPMPGMPMFMPPASGFMPPHMMMYPPNPYMMMHPAMGMQLPPQVCKYYDQLLTIQLTHLLLFFVIFSISKVSENNLLQMMTFFKILILKLCNKRISI